MLAIAAWGAGQDGPLLAALRFPDDRTPCQSTLRRRYRHLDGAALAAVPAAHVAPVGVPTVDLLGVGVDGKAPSTSRISPALQMTRRRI